MSHHSAKDELLRLRDSVAELGGVAGPNSARDFAVESTGADVAKETTPWLSLLREQAPGWLVSATLHAALVIGLGFTFLTASNGHIGRVLEVALAQEPAGGDQGTPGELSDLTITLGDLPAGMGELEASPAPLLAIPSETAPPRVPKVSMAEGDLVAAASSMLDEISAVVSDTRAIALPDHAAGDSLDGGQGAGSDGTGAKGAGRGGAGKGGNGDGGDGEGNGYAMFYGQEARGKRFVYVVDASSSMTGLRFEKALDELMKSIVELDSDQFFYVIFFNHDEFPQFFPLVDEFLSKANANSVHKLADWLKHVAPMGSTNPAPALERALKLNPDAIFLLSDGEFDIRPTMHVLDQFHRESIVIHTIALGSAVGERMLTAISNRTGGEFRFVP
jgi:hypothetical protein